MDETQPQVIPESLAQPSSDAEATQHWSIEEQREFVQLVQISSNVENLAKLSSRDVGDVLQGVQASVDLYRQLMNPSPADLERYTYELTRRIAESRRVSGTESAAE